MRCLNLILIAILLFSACQQPEKVKHAKRHQHDTVVFRKEVVAPKPIVDTTAGDTVCVAAVGDIMLGTSYPDNKTLPPDSAKGAFKNVLNDLRSADVAFGNLEGTLLDTGAPAYFKMHQLHPPYVFRMPVKYAGVIKDAGFNVLSLANNHINDFDLPGRISTTHTLDSLDIHYAGLWERPTAIFKVKGVTYGFCAFSPNGTTVSLLDLKNATRIISKLKKQCDIVIVSFHGGGEGVQYEHVLPAMEMFINEKRGDLIAFTHNAIDAGADMVFGNGPHVCRAMELYKGRIIAYSLGNFCTYKCVSVLGVCGYAPILKIYTNKKGEFLNGQIISALQTHYNGLVPDTANKAALHIRELTQTDFPASGLNIADDGRITPLKN